MNSTTKFSRRAILRDVGLGAAMLPLLQAQSARADTPKKRVLIAINSNGAIRQQFFPQGTGANLTTDATKPFNLPLSALTFGVSSKPLEPFKSDVTFLGNLAVRNHMDWIGASPIGAPDGSHHNFASVFTGVKPAAGNGALWLAGGISIDQFIADGLVSQGIKTPLRVLNTSPTLHPSTGDDGAVHANRAFYRGVGAPVADEQNVSNAFQSVFGASAGVDAAAFKRLQIERKSVLDFVATDLMRVSNRLGVDDRQKLSIHLQSVRDLEDQINTAATTVCNDQPSQGPVRTTCVKVDSSIRADGCVTLEYHERVKVFSDLIIAAFKCDVTRVATLQMAMSNGVTVDYDYKGQRYNQHSMGHDPGGIAPLLPNAPNVPFAPGPNYGSNKAGYDAEIVADFAYIIQQMKLIPEPTSVNPNATLLDNTVILWTNHMGDGYSHDQVNLPWVLAGSCGGYFKTGQYMQFSPRTPLNPIYVALANAMGMPIKTFGDTKYGGLDRVPGLVAT